VFASLGQAGGKSFNPQFQIFNLKRSVYGFGELFVNFLQLLSLRLLLEILRTVYKLISE